MEYVPIIILFSILAFTLFLDVFEIRVKLNKKEYSIKLNNRFHKGE